MTAYCEKSFFMNWDLGACYALKRRVYFYWVFGWNSFLSLVGSSLLGATSAPSVATCCKMS